MCSLVRELKFILEIYQTPNAIDRFLTIFISHFNQLHDEEKEKESGGGSWEDSDPNGIGLNSKVTNKPFFFLFQL